LEDVKKLVSRLVSNVGNVILGKNREIRSLVLALLARRHVLIEDVPGVGKTTLVRALSRSLGFSFSRIQFTPDLLPSDITGLFVFEQKSQEFVFRPGPIMNQLVLADEINRTTPKTQSSLLEAMEEGQVTIDGQTFALPRPFMVLATQNPIEYEGTFPLPEAQLDRFALRLTIGYPSPADEQRMLTDQTAGHPLENVRQVASAEDILAAQERVQEVHVADSIKEYIVRIVEATRSHRDVYLGASPRGSLALYKLTQALAAAQGRGYVLPDDVKELVSLTLAHRILLRPEARWQERTEYDILEEVVNGIRPPVTGNRV